jgi:hypothetical protein
LLISIWNEYVLAEIGSSSFFSKVDPFLFHFHVLRSYRFTIERMRGSGFAFFRPLTQEHRTAQRHHAGGVGGGVRATAVS